MLWVYLIPFVLMEVNDGLDVRRANVWRLERRRSIIEPLQNRFRIHNPAKKLVLLQYSDALLTGVPGDINAL
ncbi:unnamed protein product [Gongylonema pulchrum]|uniref:Neur_chan_LBD domain-containing protein n=1 Tax=Gongylonema pulchrum TaxID=637853 RepID=A0A183ETD7_9BILA|nr:unnamed protein product [Gongylonema pulchrum]